MSASASDPLVVRCRMEIVSFVALGLATPTRAAVEARFGTLTTLRNCTFHDFVAGTGTVIEVTGGAAVRLQNSIVYGIDPSPVAAIRVDGNGALLAVEHSDVQGGQAAVDLNPAGFLLWGGGNIDVDPLFAGPLDFHLTPGSPCVDAGDPAFVPLPGETDIDGDPRVLGPRVDMGTDELAISPR